MSVGQILRGRAALILVVSLAAPVSALADMTLLLGEPYGQLGSFSPTGHLALYLDRVCAATPLTLRTCEPGETGVVIARYSGVAGADWLAVPLLPYLYAVESSAQVPAEANRARVVSLRDAYRHENLRVLVPDKQDGRPPGGRWIQLVGATYDRRILAYSVRTSAAQDDLLIRTLNGKKNHERFNFFFQNCADFARDVLNLYFPGTFKKSVVADLGLTTPKHIAKLLIVYTDTHPELELSSFVIPQIPGNQSDSRRAKGVLEGLVTTKKYLLPLAWMQPWLPASLAAGYFSRGRFDLEQTLSATFQPFEIEARAVAASARARPVETHRIGSDQ